jgi:hypothetical protein
MTIPEEGVDVYEGKARLFDEVNMSDNGLIRSGST